MRYARVEFPMDKWVSTDPRRLDPDQKEELWQVFYESYRVVGVPHNSIQSFLGDLQVTWMVDVDNDNLPDAFIAYKKTPYGNKIQFAGAKKIAVKKMILQQLALLRKPGWYAEASHRPAEIIEGAGFKPIDDHAFVEEVLGKRVEWVGDGKYRRVITGVGVSEKGLYGHPKGLPVSRTASIADIKRGLYFTA